MEGAMNLMSFGRLLAAGSVAVLASQAVAQDSFLDVGKQEPITILINASPWYKGFENVVALYEEQTGNKVDLEVTPFDGMLEKARSAVRSSGAKACRAKPDSGFPNQLIRDSFCPWKEPHHGQAASDRVA
jgi:ABC-type glycerol-3-phosphate transport system substrate-binding protein